MKRLAILLTIGLIACGGGPPIHTYVVERQHDQPLEIRATSYTMNTSGLTPCANFYKWEGQNMYPVGTICDVRLVRTKEPRP